MKKNKKIIIIALSLLLLVAGTTSVYAYSNRTLEKSVVLFGEKTNVTTKANDSVKVFIDKKINTYKSDIKDVEDTKFVIILNDKQTSKYDIKFSDVKSLKIDVIEIEEEKTTVEEKFATIEEANVDMLVGESSIKVPGVNGSKEITTTTTYINGKKQGSKDNEKVVVAKIDEIKWIGTKEVPTASSNNSSGGVYRPSNNGNAYVPATGGNGTGGGSVTTPPKQPTGQFYGESACMAYAAQNKPADKFGYGCIDTDGDGWYEPYYR